MHALDDPDDWMLLPCDEVWRVDPDEAPAVAHALASRPGGTPGAMPGDPAALERALARGEVLLVRRAPARRLDAPESLPLPRLRDLTFGEVTRA